MAPRSRKKGKKLTVASKNVVLEALVGMPLDIIFEIFGYLDPLDVLQLARTTKALRAILMSRSSLSLWRRVRHAYYQMPDGPEGMSEPQYVSLALDRICDGCGLSSQATANTIVNIYWYAELKTCHKCESVLLANESNLKKFDLFQALPSWLTFLLQEGNKRFSKSSYSLKQVQIWAQEYASLSHSSANLKEWQCKIIEKDALTKKHKDSFYFWTIDRQRQISDEHSRLIEAIHKALLAKLEELGWGEEISKMKSWERIGLYNKFSLSSELGSFSKVWSSKGPAILKDLKAIQTARIKKEREKLLSSRYVVLREIYDEYIRGLPANALIPTVADVALFPSVHAIITDERSDFIVTRQTFEDINLMQILPSIFSDWKIRLDDELIRMVQVKLSEPFTKDQLLLATTVFYCDACHIDLFYPQVLVHRCPKPFRAIVVNCLECPAWNSSGNIKFNRNVHQAAIDIINILGLNPKTVTAEEMTVRSSVLQCLDCRTTRQGRMTMIWSRAIEHSREQHNRLPSMISWKVPDHDGQLTLQAGLAQVLAASDCLDSDSVRPRFMCGVCRRKETLVRLKQHLLSAHGIQNPGAHDILSHPDAIQAPLPCVLPEID